MPSSRHCSLAQHVHNQLTTLIRIYWDYQILLLYSGIFILVLIIILEVIFKGRVLFDSLAFESGPRLGQPVLAVCLAGPRNGNICLLIHADSYFYPFIININGFFGFCIELQLFCYYILFIIGQHIASVTPRLRAFILLLHHLIVWCSV